MLYVSLCLISIFLLANGFFFLAKIVARHLCFGAHYAEWQVRRQAEARKASYLTFLLVYANPLSDGHGFLWLYNSENRHMRWGYYLVTLAVFLLFCLAVGILAVLAVHLLNKV